MGLSYKPIVNKNNVKNKTGLYSIYIRITVDKKSRYLKTGEKIDLSSWAGKENRWVKDSHPFHFQLNSLIRKKLYVLEQFVYRQKLYDRGVSLESLCDHFYKKADANVFNEYATEYMKKVKGKSLNTLKKYRTFIRYLNEFNSKINFGQLGEPLFQSFATWLLTEKKMAGVTVHKYFDPFKVICKQAVNEGYIEKDPFQFVDIGVAPTKANQRVHLEKEELTVFKNVKLPLDRPDLEKARKHWMFCFYGGFYHSDFSRLKWENLRDSKEGYVLYGKRFKNGKRFIAPIHMFPQAIEILDDQRGKDPILIFPDTISDQKFNSKLKEIATIAGIDKNIMNKTARHSNAQLWAASGLAAQHTSKILGHSRTSTTETYYELGIEDVNAGVSSLDPSKFDI